MENLEPWEEVDGILFDKELNWVLAFTHEDVLLAVGLDHVK